MCVLGGGAAAEEAGSAYGLLPGDLRHQRLTLEVRHASDAIKSGAVIGPKSLSLYHI